MKAEIRQQWIEALRGGSYTQGRNFLRTSDDHFCCLGVLCDLVDRRAWQRERDRYAHNGYIGHLPGSISAVTDLNSDQAFTLMGMNDNGQSFGQIANWIEANIPADAA